MAVLINVPVSVGEFIDKITILEIKVARIADPVRRGHAEKELAALEAVLVASEAGGATDVTDVTDDLASLRAQLRGTNEVLWDLEDEIRELGTSNERSEEFIVAARRIYETNDHRFALKDRINRLTHSEIQEVKSYQSRGHESRDLTP